MKILASAAVVATAFASAGQFRTSTSVVEIYATVVDRAGRHVPDLTREDFQVFDNGQLRPIEVFSQGTQPITMALLVDESPSVAASAGRIQGAVEEFAKHFLPGDRATIGAFSHVVRLDPALSDRPGELVPGLLA